ncbi:hypothetical protein ABT084_37030 [Streptomyces sp. NPDC002138]|uniref:hypothetical protein n=1 Tax=Streptomyces sp. NPDC002138 TaxID=3154410 RepID=UPI003331B40F
MARRCRQEAENPEGHGRDLHIGLLVLLVALVLFGYSNHLLWVVAAVLLFALVHRGRRGGSGRHGDHRDDDDYRGYDGYRNHRDQQHRWDRRYARQHRGRRSREDRRDRDRDREEPH